MESEEPGTERADILYVIGGPKEPRSFESLEQALNQLDRRPRRRRARPWRNGDDSVLAQSLPSRARGWTSCKSGPSPNAFGRLITAKAAADAGLRWQKSRAWLFETGRRESRKPRRKNGFQSDRTLVPPAKKSRNT